MLDTRFITEIRFNVTSQSIFRIGNNDAEILFDELTNLPIIPASTIAGVFKSYLIENEAEAKLLDELFGSIKNEGQKSRVFFYDSYADNYKMSSNYEERTRASIDGITGTASNPIETAYLSGKITFPIKITIEGKSKEDIEEYISLIAGCISALDSGYIRIGAHATNGAGAFGVSNARLKTYDTHLNADLKDYLKKAEIVDSFDFKKYYVTKALTVIEANNVELETPMLTKGNGKKTNEADDVFIKNISGDYIIPGTSIKGVIRNRCRQIIEYLGLDLKLIVDIFGGSGNDDHAGSVIFSDIVIASAKEKEYTGIHLDKLTAGVIKGGLYNKKPITGKVDIKITYNDCYTKDKKDVIIAILLLAVRDLITGQINIGSGYAEGFGKISGKDISITDAGKKVVAPVHGKSDVTDRYMNALKEWRR